MSNEQYSVDYEGNSPRQNGGQEQMAQMSNPAFPFQIVAPPQKRFISAGFGMAVGVTICAVALYAAEMLAPLEFRPSTFTGAQSGWCGWLLISAL